MLDLHFEESRPFTLGVEVELQLLNPHTLDLQSAAPRILEMVPPDFSERIKQELLQSMVEVLTGICGSVDEVERDLGDGLRMAGDLARANDCLLFASSLHPFARTADQLIMEDARYQRILEELQLVGRRFITQGLHVHVGIPDRETAIIICDTMQPYLALLLALTSSSPFFEGEDTGFVSYRTKLFEALPLAGLSEFLGNWEGYVKTVRQLHDYGIIRNIRDIWWDVRPHPDFGTIEIRVCDLPTRFGDILAITAMVQAFTALLAEGAVVPQRVNNQILRYNKWQACRHGLAGTFVDALGLLTDQPIPMQRAVVLLLERLEPLLCRFGTRHHMKTIREILERGTGADIQRRLYQQTHDFQTMIQLLREDFMP